MRANKEKDVELGGGQMVSPLFERDYRMTANLETALGQAEKLDSELVYQFATPSFHVDTYLTQLVVQSLPYLCLLFFPRSFNYEAMGFITFNKAVPLFFNFFLTICVTLIVGLYLVLHAYAPEAMDPLQDAIFFPLLYWLMHVNTRAIKYATLHKVELDKFMRSKSYSEAAKYQATLQISSSWAGARSDALLDYEIMSASIRMGCDLGDLSFVVQDPSVSLAAKENFVYWNIFLQSSVTNPRCSVESLSSQTAPALVRRADGHYNVSAFDVIKTILVESDAHGAKQDATRLRVFTFLRVLGGFFLAFTYVFCSEWWVAQREIMRIGGMGLSVVFVVWAFGLILVGWLYYAVISIFLGVVFTDARRRLREAALLAELMRFSELDVNLMICTARLHTQQSPVAKKDQGQSAGAEGVSCDASTASAVHDMMCRRRTNMADCALDHRRRLTLSLDALDHIPSSPAPASAPESAPDAPSAYRGPSALRVSSMRLSLDGPPAQDAAGSRVEADAFASPRISTTFAGSNNVLVWTLVRGVFRHFGARYKYRLDANLVITCLLNFIMLVIALGLSIYSLLHPSPKFSSTRNTITSPFTIQCLVSSFNVLIFVLSATRVSSGVNQAFHEHKFLIDGHVLQTELRHTVLREQASAASGSSKLDIDRQLGDCESVLRALETCKHSIAVTDEMLPLTVVGVEASSSLLAAILSLAGSALSVFISVYMTARSIGLKARA